MNIKWDKFEGTGLPIWSFQPNNDYEKFWIRQRNNSSFWLHKDNNYIGTFRKLKSAQKVVELIIKG